MENRMRVLELKVDDLVRDVRDLKMENLKIIDNIHMLSTKLNIHTECCKD